MSSLLLAGMRNDVHPQQAIYPCPSAAAVMLDTGCLHVALCPTGTPSGGVTHLTPAAGDFSLQRIPLGCVKAAGLQAQHLCIMQ